MLSFYHRIVKKRQVSRLQDTATTLFRLNNALQLCYISLCYDLQRLQSMHRQLHMVCGTRGACSLQRSARVMPLKSE